MAIGEVVAAMIGWLGEFIQWVFSWVPRYQIVRFNERGVKYPSGKEPVALNPGIHWYVAALTRIEIHEIVRAVIGVNALTLETNDGLPVQVGMVVTYHIIDIYRFEVETTETEEAMAEVAQGALRDIVLEHTWEQLIQPANEGTLFEKKLKHRLDKVLERFGIVIETARPTDQVRLRAAYRVFNDTPLTING